MKKANAKKKSAKKKSVSSSKPKKTASPKEVTKKPVTPAFRPDLLKKDLVRQTMITVMWKKDEATLSDLVEDVKKEIGHHFSSDLELYIQNVKKDLESKKLMEESPGKKPVHYRLAQKLDKVDDEDEKLA